MSELYEVAELYERSNRLDRLCNWLFGANCAVTVLVLWPSCAQAFVVYLQVATAILHVVLCLANACSLRYDAESANRRHLIEDAFGVDITNMRSVGYYNNHFGNSLERYVADAFESSFFTMNVSGSMIPASVAKSLCACLLLVFLLMLKPTEISLSDASQAVFSAYLVEDTVFLVALHCKVKRIYERFYETMISNGVSQRKQLAILLSNAQEYECAKAYFKVKLDSDRFKQMNTRLSREWEDIEKRVKFDEGSSTGVDGSADTDPVED